MAKYFIQEETLTAIGDAIRSKTGGTDILTPAEMVTAIEGIEAGGGSGNGGNSDVDEMMLLDEWHDWEGEPPFYSYRKWIDYSTSSLSSTPVVVSVENRHESKYFHVYVYADVMNIGETYETIVLPPANEENEWYSFNSLEIEHPCYDLYIWGVRWSDDGI